jgi:hypothetical protein
MLGQHVDAAPFNLKKKRREALYLVACFHWPWAVGQTNKSIKYCCKGGASFPGLYRFLIHDSDFLDRF